MSNKCLKKLRFRHELAANDTSKTAKIKQKGDYPLAHRLNQWRIQRGAGGPCPPPLEAHVPTLPLQKSVESKAGKTRF